MRHVSMKFFALPVIMFFLLAMTSFSVATSYAANVKGGVGVLPVNVQSISAADAAKMILSNDAVVVDLRDPYTHTLFNVSDETTNVGVMGLMSQLLEGNYNGMPVVGIVDEAGESSVRQLLNAFSSILGGAQLFLTQLNPRNVQDFENAGLFVNTFENISFEELPGYVSFTKNISQVASLAEVQAALDNALKSTTPSNVAALDQAIFNAYVNGALPFVTYAEMAAAVSGFADKNDLPGALNQIQTILARAATPPVTPAPGAPAPAPLPGEGAIAPAPVPVPGELTPPAAPTPVPAPVEVEVVPPAPTPTPAPASTAPITMNDVLRALNNALANANEQNLAALNDALDRAHDAGLISDVAYNQALQLLDGLTGTSGAVQASVNEILQTLQQIQVALLGLSTPEETGVVPPVTPIVPEVSVPGVSEECFNAVYSIVSQYPDLENVDLEAMVRGVIPQSEECNLVDLVAQVNSRIAPIYRDNIPSGLFAAFTQFDDRREWTYDKAMDNGLRQAAVDSGQMTNRQASVDRMIDAMIRNVDIHGYPFPTKALIERLQPLDFPLFPRWVGKYIEAPILDTLIRVLKGKENPVDAIGNSLNDIWTRGVDF